jgi:hypothetical protein
MSDVQGLLMGLNLTTLQCDHNDYHLPALKMVLLI